MEEVKQVLNITDDRIADAVMSVSKKVCFQKHDIILNIGDAQDTVYFIQKGIVRSYYLDINGNDITKTFMQEGEFCVGESLFETEPSIQCFEALEEVETLKFHSMDLKQIILSDHDLTKTYISFLEQNLIYKMQRESSFQIMNATERYLHFHKTFENIEKRVNQSYIASYLGIAPESLSRIKKIMREKLVQMEDR